MYVAYFEIYEQTLIKTRPHLSSTAPGYFTVGIEQKTLKFDKTLFSILNTFLKNIIISP